MESKEYFVPKIFRDGLNQIFKTIGLMLICLILANSLSSSFAQTTQVGSSTSTITVTTDRTSYIIGDTIIVSGQVQPVVPNTPLTIQILDSNNNLIQVVQIDVLPDGGFTKSFSASGPTWKASGTYTVIAQYGHQNVASKTTFSFNSQLPTVSSVFNLIIPNTQQNFAIQYTITGGMVQNMTIFSPTHSLTASINTTKDGSITLQIPRTLLDAKDSSGQDAAFVILIDGAEVKPIFESANSDYRTLSIAFLQGNQDIQVMGTQLLTGQMPTLPPQAQTSSNVESNTTIQHQNTQIITPPETSQSKIPAWVKNIFIWYGRGSISDNELLGAIKFLVQQGIISIK